MTNNPSSTVLRMQVKAAVKTRGATEFPGVRTALPVALTRAYREDWINHHDPFYRGAALCVATMNDYTVGQAFGDFLRDDIEAISPEELKGYAAMAFEIAVAARRIPIQQKRSAK
jgi:hypothetical protein